MPVDCHQGADNDRRKAQVMGSCHCWTTEYCQGEGLSEAWEQHEIPRQLWSLSICNFSSVKLSILCKDEQILCGRARSPEWLRALPSRHGWLVRPYENVHADPGLGPHEDVFWGLVVNTSMSGTFPSEMKRSQ